MKIDSEIIIILFQSLHLKNGSRLRKAAKEVSSTAPLELSTSFHVTEEQFDEIYNNLFHKSTPNTDVTRNHYLLFR